MAYRANNGRKFFNPAKEISNGTFTKRTSYQPLWAIRGEDGQPSWAMDWLVFDHELPQYNITNIVFFNPRTNETFRTTYETYAKFGKRFNVGHGWQIALPFEYWEVEQGAVKQKRVAKPKVVKPAKPQKTWLQRSFFGG